jgi:SAM-dependent methyltransferase
MRYYELHEKFYQKCKDQGKDAWDVALGQSPSFEAFCLRPFAEKMLQLFPFPQKTTLRALEVGCGTGPLCCFLAEKGFITEGIDVSSTAIQIAKEQAQQRNLSIQYRVADLCQSLGESLYDLVVDGHCLHCIVFEKDRQLALTHIHQSLKPEGKFWIETMLAQPEMTLKTDENGILWKEVSEKQNYPEIVFSEGKFYLPTRKIVQNVETIEKELQEQHFKIVWSHIDFGENRHDPASYQAFCIPLK